MIKAFLAVFFLFSVGILLSQSQQDTVGKTFPSIIELTRPNLIQGFFLSRSKIMRKTEDFKVYSPSLAHTAFFCKIEDKLGKTSKLPLKMRLGGIDYVDKIEGKGLQTHIPD